MQAKKPFSVIGKTLLAALLAGGGASVQLHTVTIKQTRLNMQIATSTSPLSPDGQMMD